MWNCELNNYENFTDCHECMRVHRNSHTHICAEHASTTSPVTKLRSMIVNIKTKILLKFGTSEIIILWKELELRKKL